MVSHEDTRKRRMGMISRTLQEAEEKGIEVDDLKLAAQCCIEWGATLRTVREYIKVARLANG